MRAAMSRMINMNTAEAAAWSDIQAPEFMIGKLRVVR